VGTTGTGSTTVEFSEPDVFVDVDTIPAPTDLSSTNNSNFEQLTPVNNATSHDVLDVDDTVTATLTANVTEIAETGGTITYTVTLSGGPGAIDPDTDLVFALENGESVTIKAGEISGSVDAVYADGDITTQASIDNAFATNAVTSGGTEYENLVTAGTTSVDVDYTPVITDLTPISGGGDAVVDEDDLLASRGTDESAGSDTSKESTTQEGTFTITAGDGVSTLTIAGNTIISGGSLLSPDPSFTTAMGNTLTVTDYNSADGTVTYTYTLNDNEISTLGDDDGQDSIFEDLAVVLTDTDNDQATGTLSVQIVDDVPTAALTIGTSDPEYLSETDTGAAATVSFTLDSSASVEGADGASSVYSIELDTTDNTDTLGVDGDTGYYSGLMAANGDKIYLFEVSDSQIIGRTASNPTPAFTVDISVNAEITVTVGAQGFFHDATQLQGELVLMTGVKLLAVNTMTDGDGDESVAKVDISGRIGFTDGEPTLVTSNIAAPNAAGTYTGLLELDTAADDAFTLYQSLTAEGAGLTWSSIRDGYSFAIDAEASTPDSVVYVATNDATGETFFTVTLNNDGTYDVEIVNPDQVTTVDSGSLLQGIDGGSNLPSYTFDSSNFDGLFDLVATASNDTITISATDLGVGDNVMHGGDVLNFAVNPTQAGNDSNVTVASMTFVLSSTAGIKNGDPATFTLTYADGDTKVITTDVGSKIGTGASAYYELLLTEADIDAANNGQVTNISLTGGATESFKITGVSLEYSKQEFPNDYDLTFDVVAEDSDGDAATSSFGVSVSTDEDGVYTIDGTTGDDYVYGTSGDDILSGGAGDDILIGGAGDDILSGGADADTFDFNLADLGTTTDVAADTITDFSTAEGDVIDLSDVLGNPDNTITGIDNGGHLQIQVTNSVEGGVVQTIDVDTISVTGDVNAQAALDSLLASNNVLDS
jgi:hypothetical protein